MSYLYIDFILILIILVSECAFVSVGNGYGWCRENFVEARDIYSPKKSVRNNSTGETCFEYSFTAIVDPIPNEFYYDVESKMVYFYLLYFEHNLIQQIGLGYS